MASRIGAPWSSRLLREAARTLPLVLSMNPTLRHLKRLNALAFYAGLSCLAAFFTRLYPVFFFPLLLLRLSILAYCLSMFASTRENRKLAGFISAALLLGWIGGYWDVVEVFLHWNAPGFSQGLTWMAMAAVLCFLFLLQNNGKASS